MTRDDTMATIVIQDRGRGPEIAGTRITIYNLLPSFLDPTATEAEICNIYGLSLEQVAAARAYVLGHPDTVLAEHLNIEEKMAAGNPPEVRQQAERAKATFRMYRNWLAERESAETGDGKIQKEPQPFPTFREWLAHNAKD